MEYLGIKGIFEQLKPSNVRRHGYLKAFLTIVFLVGGFALVMVGLFKLYIAKPTKKGFTYELGETVSRDYHTYLEGNEFSISRCRIDMDELKEDKVGTYTIRVQHGLFQRFFYEIEIVDTTPPDLKLISDDIIIERDKSYEAYENVESVFDLGGDVSVVIKCNDGDSGVTGGTNVVYSENGEKTLTFIATDPSGNSTVRVVSVIVDTPPELYGIIPYFAAAGVEISFLNNVYAYDETDGYLDDIIVTVDEAYLTTPGTYEVKYYVEDQYGFSTTEIENLEIYDSMELQDKINHHELDGLAPNVLGAINPYDSGVYDDEGIDVVLDSISPALCRVRKDSGLSYSYGSGYIVTINDSKIIVCTNRHVVSKGDEYDIYFYDGTKVKGVVSGRQNTPDVAFVEVDINDLSSDFVRTLRTVHINEGYYDSLSNTPKMAIGVKTIKESGATWIERTGTVDYLSYTLPVYFAGYDYPVSKLNLKIQHGMSGSEIVDEYGNLIGMSVYTWEYQGVASYYAIMLPDIISFYEKTYGVKPNYY